MVDLIAVHQALYGYDDGHRLLASSASLAPEAQRQLRTLTDAAFEEKSGSYLTVSPLPVQRLQAFICTWPAKGWVRPGSVWSHVLLVEHADLALLEGLSALRQAFRRPTPVDAELTDADLKSYRRPLHVEPATTGIAVQASDQLLESILRGLYTSDRPVRAQVPSAEKAEEVLWAIFEQQWPRLRRTFTGRTRERASQSKEIDLELVERRLKTSEQNDASGDVPTVGEWLGVALADLKRPNRQFRAFLQLTGAESAGGRTDFASLAQIYAVSAGPDGPADTARMIRDAFPLPTTQRSLKRSLFGPFSVGPAPAGWPEFDAERIRLAFVAGPSLDFAELKVGERVVDSFRATSLGADLLGAVDVDVLSVENVEALVLGITDHADSVTATELALSQPDVGLLIVSRRLSLLADERIWTTLDSDLLMDLLAEDEEVRMQVSDSLLLYGAVVPLARICSAFPEQWWRLLTQVASNEVVLDLEQCATLRRVLERIGTAALDSPPVKLASTSELAALVLTSDLSSGLWRRVKPSDWLRAMDAVDPEQRGPHRMLPSEVVDRMFAVALASASDGGSATNRRAAWSQAFRFLHKSLESTSFDEEAWRLLSNSLPAGPDWDRCQRLRIGAAAEVRRDQWSPESVQVLLKDAHPYEGDLYDRITYHTKKKDSFVKALRRLLQ